MDECSSCQSLKKQLEDLRQKHHLDFRTIKQKIISTDTLIRSYQEKCIEHDKQKKLVAELSSKLDGAQRSVDVIKLQLKKSLEHKEPLQKKCNELERENVVQSEEIQALKDRLRGSESLVTQLQSVIQVGQKSADTMKLEASLRNDEMEDYKKSLKKNEAQISKLTEQVVTEKKANKAMQKDLNESMSQIKGLLLEKEEFQALIAKLQEQVSTGNNDLHQKETSVSVESKIETSQNVPEQKIPAENKIKSPTTPRKSPRKRKSVTPKQGKDALLSFEDERLYTRPQHKNVVKEIESSENIPLCQGETLSSESESDDEQMGTFMDRINEMLDIPHCSLSPLPPSPHQGDSNAHAHQLETNDMDFIQDSSENNESAIDDIVFENNFDKVADNNNDSNSKVACVGSKSNGDENTKESRGIKRDHSELTSQERGETLMILRSNNRRRSGNAFLSKEIEASSKSIPQALQRSKSEETTPELNAPEVNICVTRSKSLEVKNDVVLEVKPRKRRKRKNSSNDGDHETSFESSDTSTVENYTLETNEHSSNISNVVEGVIDNTKISEGNSVVEINEESRENETFKETRKRPRTRSMGEVEKNTIDEAVCKEEAVSSEADVGSSVEESNNRIKKDDEFVEISNRPQTRSMDELDVKDGVDEADSEREVSNHYSLDGSNKEGKTEEELLETPKRRQTRSMDDLERNDEVAKAVSNKEETSNGGVEIDSLPGGCSKDGKEKHFETPERPRTRSMGRLSEEDVVSEQSPSKTLREESDNKDSFLSSPTKPRSSSSISEVEDGSTKVVFCKEKASSGVEVDKSVKRTDGKAKDNDELVEVIHRPRTRSMGELAEKEIPEERVFEKGEASTKAVIGNSKQDSEKFKNDDQCLEIPKGSKNRLDVSEKDAIAEDVSSKEEKSGKATVENSEHESSGRTKDNDELLEVAKWSKSKPVNKLDKSDVANFGKDETCSSTCMNNVDSEIKGATVTQDGDSNIESLERSQTRIMKKPRCTDELRSQDLTKVRKLPMTQKNNNSETVVGEQESLYNTCNEAKLPIFENLSVADVIHNVLNSSQDKLDILANTSTDVDVEESHAGCEDMEKDFAECVNALANSIVKSDSNSKSPNGSAKDKIGAFPTNMGSESVAQESSKTSEHKQKHNVTAKVNKKTKNIDDSSESSIYESIPVVHIKKNKTNTTSDYVASDDGTGESEVSKVSESDVHRPSFNVSKEPKKTAKHGKDIDKAPKTQNKRSTEEFSVGQNLAKMELFKSTTQASVSESEVSDTFHKTAPTCTLNSPPGTSINPIEDHFEQVSTPLSPIPKSPQRRPRSPGEIPSFDSFDLHLSPIPPSPPRTDEKRESNLGVDENLKTANKATLGKKEKLKKNTLPNDCLIRYRGVNEAQFVVFILTKLKNKEVTLEQLIASFSMRKNVRNHTPICNGVIELLKLTPDDAEHALIEQCADLYERGFEDTIEPIVTEFEMQVLTALNKLCKIQRFSHLLQKLAKWSAMNLCRFFKSEKNDAGLLAMCRIYTAVCRLMGEGSSVRVLCYDILKRNNRHFMTERILLAIALVWPEALGRDTNSLTITSEAVRIPGPPYNPLLATLQVIVMSRVNSCAKTRECLQRLCGWCDVPNCNENTLAKELLCVFRASNNATLGQTAGTINDLAYESMKSLELLSVIMGWKWTNDVLVREILWPVFEEWKTKGFHSNPELGSSTAVVAKTTKSNAECEEYNHEANMDTIIGNVLRLLGALGCNGLQNEATVDLNAMTNLMCAIVSRPSCEKVSYNVQLLAATALLDIISADPMKIAGVLQDWRKRNCKRDDKMTVQFQRRMKELRSKMWKA